MPQFPFLKESRSTAGFCEEPGPSNMWLIDHIF